VRERGLIDFARPIMSQIALITGNRVEAEVIATDGRPTQDDDHYSIVTRSIGPLITGGHR
jgi:hypothetical protein